MVDPFIGLAVSVQSNPGVYALLLGSGLSKAAGVPTGWDVVNNLIRRVAEVKKEDCDPDPAAWYQKSNGREADYSEILNELTCSPSERVSLLRGFFEPTDEEREQNLKEPTLAH